MLYAVMFGKNLYRISSSVLHKEIQNETTRACDRSIHTAYRFRIPSAAKYKKYGTITLLSARHASPQYGSQSRRPRVCVERYYESFLSSDDVCVKCVVYRVDYCRRQPLEKTHRRLDRDVVRDRRWRHDK